MLKQEYIYNALITNVVDGDTVDLMVDLGFGTHRQDRFRLARINTAELNSKIEDEKKLAQDAKNWMMAFLNQKVIFKSMRKDKYGRYLAELYLPDQTVSLNQRLINSGLAQLYIG